MTTLRFYTELAEKKRIHVTCYLTRIEVKKRSHSCDGHVFFRIINDIAYAEALTIFILLDIWLWALQISHCKAHILTFYVGSSQNHVRRSDHWFIVGSSKASCGRIFSVFNRPLERHPLEYSSDLGGNSKSKLLACRWCRLHLVPSYLVYCLVRIRLVWMPNRSSKTSRQTAILFEEFVNFEALCWPCTISWTRKSHGWQVEICTMKSQGFGNVPLYSSLPTRLTSDLAGTAQLKSRTSFR